ncbi:uncharacterized protein LY89DRAFT_736965 [Mollisia scopiformis]|uniref:Uncharacterized protein n=1 Tax=Mollisia scopiformis TaxID=149040 RepID=A0A194X2A6_MOLSC|nr:uncharacterized protein LY89DRAFT_736965 [Mollisia scopiformis]KUJ13962.1 hypothetical protein LY89DRAFT_736965 [Mollisia scopiformis]
MAVQSKLAVRHAIILFFGIQVAARPVVDPILQPPTLLYDRSNATTDTHANPSRSSQMVPVGQQGFPGEMLQERGIMPGGFKVEMPAGYGAPEIDLWKKMDYGFIPIERNRSDHFLDWQTING